MNRDSAKYGFTLVELIMVISLLSVIGLATIGIVRYSYNDWDLGSRRSTLMQDGQAALEQIVRLLRQAKSFNTVSDSTDQAGYITFTNTENIIEEFSLDAVNDELDYGQPGSLNALTGSITSLAFTCYDIDGSLLANPVEITDIKSVQISAVFTDPNDSSVNFTFAGRAFCATESAIPGLISRYKLDETSGFAAEDSAGSNDGALTNMNGNEWTNGILGGALEFDGVNDYIDVGDVGDDIDVTKGTVSGWVELNSSSTASALFSARVNNDNQITLVWRLDDTGFAMRYYANGVEKSVEIPSALIDEDDGKQHFVAMTWDKAADELKVFHDGAQYGSTQTGLGVFSGSIGTNVGIGMNKLDGIGILAGKIDDVRIYNMALSAAEVAVLANVLRYREFTEAKTSSDTTSLTISKPGDTSEGDLLIAAVATDDDTSSSLAPPGGEGWTEIDVTDYSSAVTLGVWWKNADASESATHQFTWTGDQPAYGWMMRFTGHDSSDPIGDDTGSGSTGTSPSSPAVTTAGIYSLVLRLGAFDDTDITEDSPGLAGHIPITMDSAASGGTVTLESTTLSYESGGDDEFDVSMPSTRPDGDLYIAQIAQEGGASINGIPSGWTEITDRDKDGNIRFATYWKIGSSEPSTYTWEANSSKKWIGAIHRISGINTGSPINASGDGTGDNSSPTAPSVTTTVDNCLILRMYGAEGDEQKSTYWPSGTTAIFQDDSSGSVVSAGAYEYEVSASSTGTGVFSMNGSKKWVAATVAITPGGGEGGVSGGAGYLSQSSSGSSGTSAFSLTASQEARLLTIEIKPDPDGGSK